MKLSHQTLFNQSMILWFLFPSLFFTLHYNQITLFSLFLVLFLLSCARWCFVWCCDRNLCFCWWKQYFNARVYLQMNFVSSYLLQVMLYASACLCVHLLQHCVASLYRKALQLTLNRVRQIEWVTSEANISSILRRREHLFQGRRRGCSEGSTLLTEAEHVH